MPIVFSCPGHALLALSQIRQSNLCTRAECDDVGVVYEVVAEAACPSIGHKACIFDGSGEWRSASSNNEFCRHNNSCASGLPLACGFCAATKRKSATLAGTPASCTYRAGRRVRMSRQCPVSCLARLHIHWPSCLPSVPISVHIFQSTKRRALGAISAGPTSGPRRRFLVGNSQIIS